MRAGQPPRTGQELAIEDRDRHTVRPSAVAPFGGFSRRTLLKGRAATGLPIAAGALVWPPQQSARVARLLAMPDGSYIAASAILAATPIQLVRESGDTPVMTLQDVETVSCLRRAG